MADESSSFLHYEVQDDQSVEDPLGEFFNPPTQTYVDDAESPEGEMRSNPSTDRFNERVNEMERNSNNSRLNNPASELLVSIESRLVVEDSEDTPTSEHCTLEEFDLPTGEIRLDFDDHCTFGGLDLPTGEILFGCESAFDWEDLQVYFNEDIDQNQYIELIEVSEDQLLENYLAGPNGFRQFH